MTDIEDGANKIGKELVIKVLKKPVKELGNSIVAVGFPEVGSATLQQSQIADSVSDNERSDEIDPFLLQALSNDRDRLMLLKLDKELERFINDTTRQRLEFPHMTSFHRRMVHRVADYFHLAHMSEQNEEGKRVVVLYKQLNSRIPVLRFSDLCEKVLDTQPKLQIMRRETPHRILQRPSSSKNTSSKSDSKATAAAEINKTVASREEEYAKARALIFDDGCDADEGGSSGSNGSQSESCSISELHQGNKSTPSVSPASLPLECGSRTKHKTKPKSKKHRNKNVQTSRKSQKKKSGEIRWTSTTIFEPGLYDRRNPPRERFVYPVPPERQPQFRPYRMGVLPHHLSSDVAEHGTQLGSTFKPCETTSMQVPVGSGGEFARHDIHTLSPMQMPPAQPKYFSVPGTLGLSTNMNAQMPGESPSVPPHGNAAPNNAKHSVAYDHVTPNNSIWHEGIDLIQHQDGQSHLSPSDQAPHIHQSLPQRPIHQPPQHQQAPHLLQYQPGTGPTQNVRVPLNTQSTAPASNRHMSPHSINAGHVRHSGKQCRSTKLQPQLARSGQPTNQNTLHQLRSPSMTHRIPLKAPGHLPAGMSHFDPQRVQKLPNDMSSSMLRVDQLHSDQGLSEQMQHRRFSPGSAHRQPQIMQHAVQHVPQGMSRTFSPNPLPGTATRGMNVNMNAIHHTPRQTPPMTSSQNTGFISTDLSAFETNRPSPKSTELFDPDKPLVHSAEGSVGDSINTSGIVTKIQSSKSTQVTYSPSPSSPAQRDVKNMQNKRKYFVPPRLKNKDQSLSKTTHQLVSLSISQTPPNIFCCHPPRTAVYGDIPMVQPSLQISGISSGGGNGRRASGSSSEPRQESTNLMFDYSTTLSNSGIQYVKAKPAPTPPPHILEVYDLPGDIKNWQADILLEDVKQAGGSIKWLTPSIIVVIFPTVTKAENALRTVKSEKFKLRHWSGRLQ